jgi:hypothetical protein
MEFRADYWNWRRIIEAAGLRVTEVHKDFGPPVFKNANLKRSAVRLAGKIISALPYLQYQFVFLIQKPQLSP